MSIRYSPLAGTRRPSITLVEGLGIELNPAYAQTAAKRLADRGYRPLIEMMRKPLEMPGKGD